MKLILLYSNCLWVKS